jgi:ubiquinone biosynthesis protein COQ9
MTSSDTASAPERSDERDAAIDALLATIPFEGWTIAALRSAAGPDADLLFPGGATDMVEAFCDLADRRMAGSYTEPRLPDRVRAVIAQRLARNRPHKEAIRRGLAVMAAHPSLGARCTARTVDAIWHEAGDRSADFSWYTKRAILTGVYGATLLFWLRDDSEADAATLAFLDRRLAGVGQIGRLRARGTEFLQRFRGRSAA